MRIRPGPWLLFGVLLCAPAARGEGEECRAERVWDGDTLDVRCDRAVERVRLLRIDTPEHDEPGYAAARDALERLVRGKPLRLEGERPLDLERDRYGRQLAYLYADGTLVNVEMVRRGCSRFYTRYGRGRLASLFEHAQREAASAAARATPEPGSPAAADAPTPRCALSARP